MLRQRAHNNVRPQWSNRHHAVALVLCCSLFSLFSPSPIFCFLWPIFMNISKVSNLYQTEMVVKLKSFFCASFFICIFFFHLYFKNIIEASDETIYFSHSNKRTWIYDFFSHIYIPTGLIYRSSESPLFKM